MATALATLLFYACGGGGGGGNQSNHNGQPVCGNGEVEQGELCDDGPNNSDTEPDACRHSCWPANCGDGVIDSSEDCDGTDLGYSGCADLPGFNHGTMWCTGYCVLDVSGCYLCGDGVVDSGEDCDGTNLGGMTCESLGAPPDGHLRCTADCLIDVTGCSWCGNGVIEGDEECDDASQNSDVVPDACRASCMLPGCGDLVIDSGEECDDGPANSDITPDACRASCRSASCGDLVIDSGEQCDEGLANADLPDAACRTDCLGRRCGDGIIDPLAGEQCDGGPTNADLPDAACRTDCLGRRCGDGIIDPLAGEECDDGPANSDTSPDACRTSCAAARCGDGVLDSFEQCDDLGAAPGDGCSDLCEVEGFGWQCVGEPSLCSCRLYWVGPQCETCTVYVNAGTPAVTGDGTSWDTAFAALQNGLDAAVLWGPGCEVWAAAGRYRVYVSARTDTLLVQTGTAAYGGFAGGETDRSQRRWADNVTILDGTEDTVDGTNVYGCGSFQSTLLTMRRFGLRLGIMTGGTSPST